ncbi:MAG TPA: error-prone DNA polymerase, partial [Burkholderiaceae bacterium]|nr:error-prone DNA polymerase [Burkholderiaceae bacterium]
LLTAGGEHYAKLVLLATDRAAYGNLSEFITLARTRADKGSYRAYASDLEGKAAGHPHLQNLPGCLALLIPSADASFEQLFGQAMWLKTWFPERAWIAVENLLRATDGPQIERIERVGSITGVPLVAAGDVHMHLRSRKPVLDVAAAIRLGKPVAECGFALASNAEQYLRPRVRLAQLYAPEWLDETLKIAARCQFSLNELRYEYPEEIVPPGETATSHLRALTEAGARERFPEGVPLAVREQIEKELALVAELRYEAFFLTIEDIVRFARAQGILCQGRGSAANSVVCYCLRITEVDPRRCSVLFERFISRERNEPPDIDVDFEHQRREQVIQYIYNKYGRDRAALAATVICYRSRSVLRDVGKALGFDPQRIDQVAKNHQWWDSGQRHAKGMLEAGFDPDSLAIQQWLAIANELRGFPRHLSQHVGGFVIARTRLSRLVPIENAAMEERCVIQWDKDDLEALGLLKVDVLALGMLSATRRALEFIASKLGRPFEMGDIEDDDTPTYDMICAADTIGTFQIESRAQMTMLPRLKPRCYYDLVVEVAIVRPGPIQGGMVHPYLRRRDKKEPVDYPNAEIKLVLERTLGVPIFQEQVMQLAIVAADYTPGEADQLRRSMAAWKRKGGLGPHKVRLISRMTAKGYTLEYAERIFKQIEGFGEYGFPESHAASFALLAYVSCWIKRHHPDAFLAGLLNSQPMGFYAPAQLVQDARRHGVEVRAVDVTISQAESTLEPPVNGAETNGVETKAVRLGLNRISGFREDSIKRIVEARSERAFDNVEDLAMRAQLNSFDLEALAASGALATLAGHRHQAGWEALGVETRRTQMLKPARFPEPRIDLAPPTEGADIVADYERLGLTLGRHPLALLRPRLAKMKMRTSIELQTTPSGRIARACGIVTHRQRPQTAKGSVFVTIEDETGPVNIIFWNDIFERERKVVVGSTLLGVQGVWQSEAGVMHLLAKRATDYSSLLGRLATSSRDFH